MAGSDAGRRKGGLVTAARHPDILRKARELANARAKARATALRDTPLTVELAELLGAFIGDGFTNKYYRAGMTQFVGHSVLDGRYMREHLAGMLRSITDAKIAFHEKGNTLRMTIYSNGLFRLWAERFQMPAGKKCYTVVIPDEVLRAGPEITNACIRGIFDTDGCVSFDKRSSYRTPYLRILLHMSSPVLLRQISAVLRAQGIPARITKCGLQINGARNCALYLRHVGFSNERHRRKLRDLPFPHSDADPAKI